MVRREGGWERRKEERWEGKKDRRTRTHRVKVRLTNRDLFGPLLDILVLCPSHEGILVG